jgi:hypothetical protein
VTGFGARLAAATHEAVRDSSFYTLFAANAAALAIVLITGGSMPHMLAAFWAQSVIIGVTSFCRLQAMPETTEDKAGLAFVFVTIYGGLHYAYFGLVESLGRQRGVDPFAGFEFWLCALAFAAHHVYSLLHNLDDDTAGRPTLLALLLMPYIRVAPMMLAGAVALAFPAGALAHVVMAALKTWIDLALHSAEHHVFNKGV